jgi:hypothetical protein
MILPLHPIERRHLCGIVGRHSIAQYNSAARSADAHHLGKGALGRFEMMERKATTNNVE